MKTLHNTANFVSCTNLSINLMRLFSIILLTFGRSR